LATLVETVMSRVSDRKSSEAPNWNLMYRQGTPPWDTGRPAGELVRLVQRGVLQPGTTLELGCGTGADAIYLSRRGFEVTAVDSSPLAVERARTRAEDEDALVRFVLADAFEFAPTAGQFDLVFDAGFYHFIRRVDLERFLDLLWRVTRPGSQYLTLAGSADETAEGGPPRVAQEEIHSELGRLFEFCHLKPFRFETPDRPEGYLGWSCLMRRPVIGG
jgi:SAM-dependent methyltransferase